MKSSRSEITVSVGQILDRLKELRHIEPKYGSDTALARSLGLKIQVIANWRQREEVGWKTLKEVLTPQEFQIVWMFSVGQDISAGHEVLAEGMTSIPLMAHVGAGANYAVDLPLDDQKRLILPLSFIPRGKRAYALRVEGRSAEPHIFDGDFLVVSPMKAEDLKSGNDYVFVTEDGPQVKKAILGQGWPILRSYNSKKFPDKVVNQIFRVFEIVGHLHHYRPLE